MSPCRITTLFAFALFPYVGKAIEISVETDPPGMPVTWSGDLGETPQFSDQDHLLATSYDTPGPKTLTVKCNGDEVSKTIRIHELPPAPLPFDLSRLGLPEHVPELLYISTIEPAADSFLEEAVKFHEEWGLTPRRVDSLEEIVVELAAGPSRALKRIRIVGHASEDGLGLHLFEGSPAGLLEPELREFAKSDAHGLSELIGHQRRDALEEFAEPLIQIIGRDHPNLVAIFGLSIPVRPGVLEELLLRQFELSLMRPEIITNLDQIQFPEPVKEEELALKKLLQLLGPEVRKATGQPAARVRELIRAIKAAVTELEAGLVLQPFELAPGRDHYVSLQAALRAIKDGFRRKLSKARRRFRTSTWIDIRGCRTGVNLPFMAAVSEFFANKGQKPHVTAPDMFQEFGRPLSIFLHHDMLGDFASIANRAEVKAAVEHWASITRVADHLPDENWDTLSPRLKLHRYLGLAGILPVPGNSHTPTAVATLLLMDFSGASEAIDRWVESQWIPLADVDVAAEALRTRWFGAGSPNYGQPPPFVGVSSSLNDVPGQEGFISTDTRYRSHIIEFP